MPEHWYKKWDNIELSDDEDDPVPRADIDPEDWYKMKRRARVEREEKEEEDKVKLKKEMTKTKLRIEELEQQLKKTSFNKDDDHVDGLDGVEGLELELKELKKSNASKQKKLDDYERDKKWNVDNLCHVADERTIVNPNKPEPKVSSKGYVLADDEDEIPEKEEPSINDRIAQQAKEIHDLMNKKKKKGKKKGSNKPKVINSLLDAPKPSEEKSEAYSKFVKKHADILEKWTTIQDLDRCQEFLLLHADILLHENASDYAKEAAFEDEYNGSREKMRLTARQSQTLGYIVALAQGWEQHPGNVINTFYSRMKDEKDPEFYKGFEEDTEDFIKRIIKRVAEKKYEERANAYYDNL